MVSLIDFLVGGLESAFITLIDYLSLHVLLCLVPAFFIAGAMTYFIPKETIIRYIGKDADPKVAYPMATAAGFILAVCSCTVLPLFVGIWKRGAGIGPAITFLFVAPAINILALTYTGTLIGLDIALARGTLAIIFAILIGIIMSVLFGKDTDLNDSSIKNSSLIPQEESYSGSNLQKSNILLLIIWLVCSILLAILDVNIINFLSEISLGSIPLIGQFLFYPPLLQTSIFAIGFIILLIITKSQDNNVLKLFLWLVFILMTGTSQISYFNASIEIFGVSVHQSITNMGLKLFLTFINIITMYMLVIREIDKDETEAWMAETFIFVKSILPLILIGVTIAGFVRYFIPTELIALLVGQNTVLANLVAVLFGVFMYFPTLMEVPIARILLDLGMARGPLLAYLLADPELSIQSILVTRKYLGDQKNLVFIGLVTLFSVIAGLFFGLVVG